MPHLIQMSTLDVSAVSWGPGWLWPKNEDMRTVSLNPTVEVVSQTAKYLSKTCFYEFYKSKGNWIILWFNH